MKKNEEWMETRRSGRKKPIWAAAFLICCTVVVTFQLVHHRTDSKELTDKAKSVQTMLTGQSVQTAEQAKSAQAADKQAPAWTENQLIAHALGGIDGETYTNSYDAFLQNYAAGDRVFETDLLLTSDDYLVARHDWGRDTSERLQPSLPDKEKDGPVPLADFMSANIMGKYRPLNVDNIIQILRDHPDMYLVTDTKETDPKLISRQFTTIVKKAQDADPSILSRIIPELYSEEMIKQVKSIYAFPNYLFSTYLSSYNESEVEDIVKRNGVRTVAMPVERATPGLIAGLNELGASTYVHTVNDTNEIKRLQDIGVHGFYSDFLTNLDPVSKTQVNQGKA